MNEPVYTIVGSDEEPPATACASISVWKFGAEATENARLETLERESSASPPYLYRGRKGRCFVQPRKMRWRKG